MFVVEWQGRVVVESAIERNAVSRGHSIRAPQNLAQVPTHHTNILLGHEGIFSKFHHPIATLACCNDRFKFLYDAYDSLNEDSTYIPLTSLHPTDGLRP